MGVFYRYCSASVSSSYCTQCGHSAKKTKVNVQDAKNESHGHILRCRNCGHIELYLNSDKDIELLLAGRFFSGKKS